MALNAYAHAVRSNRAPARGRRHRIEHLALVATRRRAAVRTAGRHWRRCSPATAHRATLWQHCEIDARPAARGARVPVRATGRAKRGCSSAAAGTLAGRAARSAVRSSTARSTGPRADGTARGRNPSAGRTEDEAGHRRLHVGRGVGLVRRSAQGHHLAGDARRPRRALGRRLRRAPAKLDDRVGRWSRSSTARSSTGATRRALTAPAPSLQH